MVEKLNPHDERRIMKCLEGAVASTRAGISPDDALTKAAADAGLAPEMVKLACGAFNKSKSVHLLTKLSADRRAEPFELADADKVIARLFGAQEKQAAEMPKGDWSQLGLRKAAALKPEPRVNSWTHENEGLIHARNQKEVIRGLEKFAFLRDEMNVREEAVKQSTMAVADQMRYMRPDALRKAARLVVNRYGEDGERLMRYVSLKLKQDLPLEKTACSAVFPLAEPYIAINRAMDSLKKYHEAKGVLHGFFTKSAAGDGLVGAQALAMGAMPASMVGGAMMGSVQGGILAVGDQASKWHQIAQSEPSGSKGEQFLDPAFVGKLDALDLEQTWTDLLSDPYIKTFPIEQSTKAMNEVVNVMPMLRMPRYKAFLGAMVKKQLAQGNNFDPAEVANMSMVSKNLAQADQAQGNRGLDMTYQRVRTNKLNGGGEATLANPMPDLGASGKAMGDFFKDMLSGKDKHEKAEKPERPEKQQSDNTNKNPNRPQGGAPAANKHAEPPAPTEQPDLDDIQGSAV